MTKKPNRLASEKSPYLQQHAHNPVDWYPWGEEAFEEARRSDKPIFLSIGYSTCHWCHVMERESFENEEIAARMNESWVSVKVDREERPDIDAVYMTVCQMVTGQGGWPLNLLLDHDRRPFYAGTYIPPESWQGRIGMRELIPRVNHLWNDQRNRVSQSAEEITGLLRAQSEIDTSGDLDVQTWIDTAARTLAGQYDPRHGGFGSAPKFPMPHSLIMLLRRGRNGGQDEHIDEVVHTLGAMSRGGIHDQVGGGFHRYSTDAEWLVPHFEKMLYDQALMARACIEAWLLTSEDELLETAEDVCKYVLRDLRRHDGLFFAAEDADSEGEEGKFYVWTTDELRNLLSKRDFELAVRRYGLDESGNYEDEASRRKTGANILFQATGIEELAADLGEDLQSISLRFSRIRETIFEAREKRVRPHRDEKVLTDWNGLMIGALALFGKAAESKATIEAAILAADRLLEQVRREDGRLHHRTVGDETSIEGNIDDYAFLVYGLLELYDATLDPRWLRESKALTSVALEDFWDDERGGFYFVGRHVDPVLVRRKEVQDGAIPSGNSMFVHNLVRLGRLLAEPEYGKKAERIGMAFTRQIEQAPTAHTWLLAGLELGRAPSTEIVVVGSKSDSETLLLLDSARTGFAVERSLIWLPPAEASQEHEILVELAPFLKDFTTVDGRPAAYVCEGFTCQRPTTDPEEVKAQLGAS